jgi:quercetin dioxygenase-like cupin family protein
MIPGSEFYRIWGGDEPPVFPDDGSLRSAPDFFPPVGGFRFGLFTIAPESNARPADLDITRALQEMDEKLPGMGAYFEPDHPGMHTTDSIDFEYVISGEVWLELDDGKEVHLKPGDTVVQNGTRHAWRNKGTQPCRILFCLVGAHRR